MSQRRRYRFSYQAIEQYDSVVSGYHFLLRCTPCDDDFQRLEEYHLHLLSDVEYSQAEDSFSNVIHYGSLVAPHDLFVVSASGVVACGDYEIEDKAPHHIFLAQSHLTRPDREVEALGLSVDTTGEAFDVAQRLSEAIFARMHYQSGITSVTTTAAMALTLGVGVCQDYAHLLIALCRQNAIFARYVMGYVAGEGATHAWVEVWSDGVWRGIDPTHNCVVRDGYIKLAHGRDASDCSVIRGMRRGVVTSVSQVRVIVEPLL